ncbi:MAG: Type I Iterative PKS [Alyxoria varia]|nr:MAG: Type I Iterative PKS [Alyxoria varia]
MVHEVQVLLFGDQSEDIIGELQQLILLRNNLLLSSFFEKAYKTLRDEVAHNAEERQRLPGFTSIETLLARYVEKGVKSPAIESALVSIYQTATLLRHSGDGVEAYPTSENTRLVGSCTGLLSALSLSCAGSYAQLVSVSVATLKLAFRIGAQVGKIRDALEQESTGSASWSAIFPGVTKDVAPSTLEEYCRQHGVPATSRPYLSATGNNSVTISAHPRELDSLIDSGVLKCGRPVRLPIHGPYHAPHLYNNQVVASLLRTIPDTTSAEWTSRIPIIANDEEQQTYTARTFNELMPEIIQDILQKSLDWKRVCESCVESVKELNPEQCRLTPVGGKNAAGSIINSFSIQKCAFKVFTDDQKSKVQEDAQPSGRKGSSKIAIVGMSGRFPDAADPDAFWDLLKQGLDVHREVPSDRFDIRTHVDPTGKKRNTSHTPYGCFVEDPGLFDAKFFNMSPKEATQTDPMHRLALSTAYEALEMSGFVPNRTPSSSVDRVGTFYGQTSDDWREIQDGQNIQTYFIPGGVRAFATGRINYHFGFSGPSFSVDTACSSSLAAINIACNSLWLGECDTALAGGLNILTNPDIFSGLSRGQFLSKTGNCKTFDDGADGYCRGDGAGSVVLKRLEDAEADRDPILATILSTETNHSADAVSITHPHAGNQQYLFKKVLTEAGMKPNDISYVEMHGTGTQAGDAIEMESVLNSFAPEKRPDDRPLYLGSVKSNIGHGEAASGICALIKNLLMLDHELIPPHCGIKGQINHNFPDLEALGVHISRGRETPWKRPEGGKRRLFLNNFSAAGGNSSLLMEDGPLMIRDSTNDPRPTAVVAVSGKTKTAFMQNLKGLAEYLGYNPGTDLPSLSYTTTARRSHYQFRTIVSGSDIAEIETGLRKAAEGNHSPLSSAKPSVIFCFTGQGAHYTAMGKQLYDSVPQFKSDIDRFDLLAQSHGFPSILPLIDGRVPIDTLSPVVVQTGAICIQLALVQLWSILGVTPSAVVGHSLGEYAALYAAGVVSINDAIFLTAKRAAILEKNCAKGTHAMLAVSAPSDDLSDIIDGVTYELACINGPKSAVISGESDKIDQLKEELGSKRIKSTKLDVPFAFHSSQVDPALDEFEAATADITFDTPKVPVISPLLSSVIQERGHVNPNYLRRHFRMTVNFLGGFEAAMEAKVITDNSVFIEIGSHPVCTGMVKSILGSSRVAVPSVHREENVWKTLAGSFCSLYTAGIDISWEKYHDNFPECQNTLHLPAYAWEASNYWIDYVNDWCLTKGAPPVTGDVQQKKSSISTSTVQRVVDESFKDRSGTITTETDIQRPDLEETIRGHLVNGSALCSSAVYADMALTIGDYIHRKLQPDDEDFTLNCSHMVVEKPLIAGDASKPQLLRTHTTADMSQGSCKILFYSVNDKGEKTIEQAHCEVQYGDSSKLSTALSRQKYLIQSQIDRLIKEVQEGTLSKLSRKMTYKLFSVLVDYQDVYKGMAEVILDSPNREGSARVEPQTSSKGNFFFAPFQIDSLCHLAGFIMNANDELDSTQTVFVNHGWESIEFLERPKPDQVYRSYVRMQPNGPDSNDYVGDVYVFNDSGELVGRIGGIEFQYMRKQILDRVLPKAGGAKSSAPAPAAKAPAKPSKPEKTRTKPSKSEPQPESVPAAAGNIARALDIVADEIGVSVGDLGDDDELAALGVDSLMSLTLSGRLKEEMELEVDSNSIGDCQTVKEVKSIFKSHGPESGEVSSSSTEPSRSDTSTPRSEGASSATSMSDVDEVPVSKGTGKTDLVREVLSEETGNPADDITSDTDLASVGVDSLMSLQILGTLREDKDLELPQTFFADHETFGDVEKALGGGPEEAPPPPPPEPAEPAPAKPQEKPQPPAQTPKKTYKASSVLLQGSPKTASQTLFVIPDGSGSPTSYSTIPSIAPKELALIALGCPFMKDAEAWQSGIPGVAALYIDEIRRRQPHGPYVLGGWSAGGICAYEACLQLQAAGETVEKLVFLDVPCPLPPQELPARLHYFFDEIGLLGAEGEAPDWLLPHFTATIRALSSYRPRIMEPAKEHVPKVYTIMARDGVCKHDTDPRPETTPDDPPHMGWLLFNRTDFGPIGWDGLLGGTENIVPLEPIADANHFTMLREPGVSEVPKRIRTALGVSG